MKRRREEEKPRQEIQIDRQGFQLVRALLNYNKDASDKKFMFYARLMRDPNAVGNVLFLCDGNSSVLPPLAPELKSFGCHIFQTDIHFGEVPVVEGNIVKMKVDLSLPFPFKEGVKFDAILMRQGLCFCDDIMPHVSCGGIQKNRESAKRFVLRVADLLNVRNGKALALLEGIDNNRGDRNLEFWKKVARNVMRECQMVDVQIIVDSSGRNFYALKICTKATQKRNEEQ